MCVPGGTVALGEVAAAAQARAARDAASGSGLAQAAPDSDASLEVVVAGKKRTVTFVPKLPPLATLRSSPVAPPPSVLFTADRAPVASVTVPPGAFRFFFGWIPLADAQGLTFWWNTVTNVTTYQYPTQAADEPARIVSGSSGCGMPSP